MENVAALLEEAGALHSLFWVASGCHPRTDEMLKGPTDRFCASLDMRNKEGNTALHVAALRRRTEACTVMLQNGADASIKNSKGLTAAQLPAVRQDKKLQTMLLAAEEKVNGVFVAVLGGREAGCLEVLDAPQVSLQVTNSQGYTLLDAAVDGNKTEAQVLLRKHAVQHSLFWAVESSDVDLLRMLLEGQADPFQRDCQGNTALHLATDKSDVQCARYCCYMEPDLNTQSIALG
jgi:hypothetical protein